MKYRVKFHRRIKGRETVECIMEAEDLEDAEMKFGAYEFKSLLVTERIFDDFDVIEGPVFEPVMTID